MVYDRITPSDESGGIGFRKVKNFSAMHRRYVKMMPVNEVSGYRKFGGCLDAYMDAHLKPNMMETSKQSERTIKIKVAIQYRTVTYCTLKLYIEKEI